MKRVPKKGVPAVASGAAVAVVGGGVARDVAGAAVGIAGKF
jgi:hypothetical protein